MTFSVSFNQNNSFGSAQRVNNNSVKSPVYENPSLFTGVTFNGVAPTSMFEGSGLGFFNFNFGSVLNAVSNFNLPAFNMPMFNMNTFAGGNFFSGFSGINLFPALGQSTFNFGSFGTNVRAASSTAHTARAQKAVDVALSQVGVRENGSTNNSAEVNKYRFGKANGNPWCASFVSYCYGQGQGNSNKATFGFTESSQSIKNQAIKAGKYSTKASGYKPQVGDLAVWTYDKNSGHVGIIASVNQDGTFDVVEGNCGDKVQRCTRSMNTKDLNGFVRMNEWVEA